MATPGNKMTGKDAEARGEERVERTAPKTPYKIQIPMYEGPLDLLLDLIKQQKMNIHDIQISKITAQYLEYLHKLEELDVDVSAEFIYMAATLIYIKSKMLLPPDPLGETEEAGGDPRAELVQRLVEHEKFKNAAQLLYQKQQIEANVWSKPDKSLYHGEGTEGELVVSLVDLVKVFQQVLERRKEVSRIELRHEEFTVAQMIAALRAQIRDHLRHGELFVPQLDPRNFLPSLQHLLEHFHQIHQRNHQLALGPFAVVQRLVRLRPHVRFNL